MISKTCLCGRVAHRKKFGSYVCLRCDEIEKKNKKMFVDMFDGSGNCERSRRMKALKNPLDHNAGFCSLLVR